MMNATDTHPDVQDLQSWSDGEVSDVALRTEITDHVGQCEQCRDVVRTVTSLAEGVRLWADSLEVAPTDSNALADAIFAAVPATSAGERRVAEPSAAEPARVLAMRRPERRNWSWMVGPGLLAAAAVVASVWVAPDAGGGSGGSARGARGATGQPAAERAATMAVDAGPAHAPRVPLPLPGDPGGSDLRAMDFDGDATNVAVMSVPGLREGSTVTVVFIDDGYDQDLAEATKTAVK